MRGKNVEFKMHFKKNYHRDNRLVIKKISNSSNKRCCNKRVRHNVKENDNFI